MLSCLFLFCLLSKVAVTLSLFRAGLQSKYVLIMKKVQEKHHDKRKRKLPALVLRPLSGNTQTYQQTSSRKNKYFFTLTKKRGRSEPFLMEVVLRVVSSQSRTSADFVCTNYDVKSFTELAVPPSQHTKMALGLH